MKNRILIGALLVLGVAAVFLLDRYIFGHPIVSRVAVWLLAIGALHEVVVMGARRIECGPGLFMMGAIAIVAVVTPYVIMGREVPGTLLVLAAVAAGGIRLLGMAPLRSAPAAFPEATLLAAALLYTGGLLSFLDHLLVRGGLWTALAVLAIAKSTDVCAYFVGTLVGRRRIAPAISPKKTWEGTIAGVLGAAGVAALLAPELIGSPAFAAAIGAFLGVASFLGDLIASGIKRWAGVKDSSALLPEFGGFVDLVDGILVAAPVSVVCLYGA